MHYLTKPSTLPAHIFCVYLDQILCGGPEQALYPGGAEGPLVVAHNSINNCNNAKTIEEKESPGDDYYFGHFDDALSRFPLGNIAKGKPPANGYYPASGNFKLYVQYGLWPLKYIAMDISAPDDPQSYFDEDELDPDDTNEELPIWYKHKINEWLADRHIQQERSAFEEDTPEVIFGSGIAWQEGVMAND